MTNAETLDKSQFRESPDGQWRYHVELRKAFPAESVRDATEEWTNKCLREPVLPGFFDFYFWTGGNDRNAMVGPKALLNQLCRNEQITIKRRS